MAETLADRLVVDDPEVVARLAECPVELDKDGDAMVRVDGRTGLWLDPDDLREAADAIEEVYESQEAEP